MMLTPITLYRATSDVSDADTVPDGTCWAERREDAVAYTDNPGFGGPHIVSVTVSDRYAGSILDLRGDHWEKNGEWDVLAEALGYASVKKLRRDYGADEYENIEQMLDEPEVRARLARTYNWAVYHDTYPIGCTTWCKLGGKANMGAA